MSSDLLSGEETCLKLDSKSGSYSFPEYVGCAKFIVEWSSRSKMFCELKLQIFCYDERARFVEKLTDHKMVSEDGGCALLSQVKPSAGAQDRYVATAKIEFDKIHPRTAAIAIFLNGEPRIFQFIDHITSLCSHVPANGDEVSFILNAASLNTDLFKSSLRPHKDYQGITLCVLYKEKWIEHTSEEGKCSVTAIWAAKAVLEPCYMQTTREKDEKVQQATVYAVPALERYRPRIFENIRDMCAALSSRALPKLKKSFLRSATGGLNLEQFTFVLFNQLYETFPRVAEPSERGYVVALIHEMFSQIDYNNDNCNDWDEFTTFCVQIGVGGTGPQQSTNGVGVSERETLASGDARNLDQYIIEYGEDILLRDRFLSQQRGVCVLREIPGNTRMILIQDEGESVMLVDEDFRPRSTFEPVKLLTYGTTPTHGKKTAEAISQGSYRRIFVYDCIYLTGKDLFATCSSDHAISLIKESTTLATGTAKSSFMLQNRIYHNMLHTRLCWIQATEVLCSVGSDHLIYGWNIENKHPIFQVNRHEDVITDFIAIEHMEVFVTCSMDKRIVMWSAKSRRVRGILLGHERGVRCLSSHENLLLSAGFETDALTWDLVSKEQIGVLRGHRATITAAKLMCARAPTEREWRAVTVDETGEFRLWDIYIAERSSEPTPAVTLQIFEMHQGEPPLNKFKFLLMPNNPHRSTSNYSDIVACSTKLFHFLPEKNTKEFVSPSCTVFSEAAASIATAVGKSISKYDITNGKFNAIYSDLTPSDISCMCLDADKQRYLFVGTVSGIILLVNYLTGQVLDKVEAHNREVTCLTSFKRGNTNRCCASFSDGKLKMLEEINSKIRVHNTLDDPFGVSIGVSQLKISTNLRAIVAASVSSSWGVWNDTSFRRILLIKERSNVNAIEIIGANIIKGSEDRKDQLDGHSHSRNPEENEDEDEEHLGQTQKVTVKAGEAGGGGEKEPHRPREHLLTVAVAMNLCIRIYTVDMLSLRGIISHELLTLEQVYVTQMCLLKSPEFSGVNYSISSTQDVRVIGSQLVVATDGGQVLTWDANAMCSDSEKKFRSKYKALLKMEAQQQHFVPGHGEKAHSGADHTMSFANMANTVVKLKGWCHNTQQVVHSHESEAEFRRHAAGIESSYFLTDPSAMHDGHHHSGGHSNRDNEAYFKFHNYDPLQTHIHGNQIELRDLRDSAHDPSKLQQLNDPHQRRTSVDHTLDHTHNFAPREYAPHHQPQPTNPTGAQTQQHTVAPLIFIGRRPSMENTKDNHHKENTKDNHHNNHHGPATGHHHNVATNGNHSHAADGAGGGSGGGSRPMSARRRKMSMSPTKGDTAPDVLKGSAYHKQNNLGLLRKCIADRCWGAHLDTIISLQPLHEHGCILTVSLDGFHRIWNMHEQCLGELPLPNITEKMKNPAIKLNVCDHWMFILEKLRVSPKHLKIADDIITQIQIKASSYRIPSRMTMAGAQLAQLNTAGGGGGGSTATTPHHLRKQPSVSSGLEAGNPNSSVKGKLQLNVGFALQAGSATNPNTVNTVNTSRDNFSVDGRQSRLNVNDDSDVLQLPSTARSRESSHTTFQQQKFQQEQLRSQVLEDLATPPTLTDDAPPLRALTREERRLEEKNAKMMNALGLLPSIDQSNAGAQASGAIKPLFSHSMPTTGKGVAFEKSVDSTNSKEPPANHLASQSLNLVPGTMLNSLSTLELGNVQNQQRPSTTSSLVKKSLSRGANLSMWTASDDFCAHVQGNTNASPASFSEQSLVYSRHDGYINGEEYTLLRQVSSQPEKVSVYDRTEPVLFLRNPHLATSFETPDVDTADKSEISFGPQKNLYKHASKYIDDKDRQNKQSLLHSLSMARIGRDVGKVKSMIHVLPGRVHDDVVIPKDTDDDNEDDKLRSEEQRMQLRLMQSAALVPRETPVRPLDRENIDKLMSKYKEITESNDKTKDGQKHTYFKKRVITHTMRMKLSAKFEAAIKDAYKYRRQILMPHTAKEEALKTQKEKKERGSMDMGDKDSGKEKAAADGTPRKEQDKKRKESTRGRESIREKMLSVKPKEAEPAATAAAEPDLENVMHIEGDELVSSRRSSAAPHSDAKSPTRIKLTTRQLLPYYTLEDVTNFMDTFSKVDEDFSGDLDIVEWVRLFNSMNHHISEHDARMIFMKLDKNGDGYLTMRELIPVIFSRASRQQQKLIIEFASFELIKKQDGLITLSLVEMEQLFEMYDTGHIGYVAVRAIREHVYKMNLPEQPYYMFLDTVCHAAEDEMVNLSEFIRLLKLYVEKSV